MKLPTWNWMCWRDARNAKLKIAHGVSQLRILVAKLTVSLKEVEHQVEEKN